MRNKFSSNKEKYRIISVKLVDNIDSLLDHLALDYTIQSNRVSLSCPIHGSSRPSSLSIFTEGQVVGNWRCWTHHCESEYGKTIFGFIMGVLGCSFTDALKFAETFLDEEFGNLPSRNNDKELFAESVGEIASDISEPVGSITREQVRRKLYIPASYFLKRGFQKQTLDSFDVGICRNPRKRMHNRAVVPVYANGTLVGCLGRSTVEMCPHCGYYHSRDRRCVTSDYEKFLYCKWLNSKGYKSASYLYNYDNALDSIRYNQTIYLVESCSDVWRLYECGISNAVAMCTSSLSETQKKLLDKSGATHLIVLTDNDEAGQKARKKIYHQCRRSYNIITPDFPKNDVAELTHEEIERYLK